MSLRRLLGYSATALTGVAMLAAPLSPASAFTLSGPSLDRPVTAQIQSVFWRRGGGWHGGGWHGGGWHGGWGPGAIIGGLAAGALLGGFYGGYYGPYSYGYEPYAYDSGYGPYGYGDCWRDGWGRLRCY